MKNLIYLIVLSFTLLISACSDSGQDIVSPFSPKIEKGIQTEISNGKAYPYNLYQVLPQLTASRVSWYNEKEGLAIMVNDLSDKLNNKHIYAVIDFVNKRSSTMAFLGDLQDGKFYLYGFNEKDIKTITIYYYDNSKSNSEKPLPYPNSQLFKAAEVKGWSDGDDYVKVSSSLIISEISHVYTQLITDESSQLVFLGKPLSTDFDFPKSGKLVLKEVKLFSINK